MRFQVSGHLEYEVKFPSTLIFNIHAQRNSGQTILDERFSIEPYIKVEEFHLERSDSRFVRLETGRKKRITIDYAATVECECQVVTAAEINPIPFAEMDRHAIPYLFPSRYCQSDRLGRLAWDLFGKIANPYEKVVAVVDWIHANVEYLPGTTNSETSAYDTVTQRTGVCRDFAHLGIALCRALNIPSRRRPLRSSSSSQTSAVIESTISQQPCSPRKEMNAVTKSSHGQRGSKAKKPSPVPTKARMRPATMAVRLLVRMEIQPMRRILT